MSDIHTLSPTTANQGWFTFTRVAGGRVNLPSGIGMDDLGSTFTTQGPKTLPKLGRIRLLQCRRCSGRTCQQHGLLFAPRHGQHDQG